MEDDDATDDDDDDAKGTVYRDSSLLNPNAAVRTISDQTTCRQKSELELEAKAAARPKAKGTKGGNRALATIT